MTIKDRLEEWEHCPICACIDDLLAAIVASEALEHNYTMQAQGRLPASYREVLADIGLAAWVKGIGEKCKVDVSGIERLRRESYEERDKVQSAEVRRGSFEERALFGHAASVMTDLKMKLFDLGQELCKKADNPGIEETHIDPFDIEVLQYWLKLAKTKGTKAIRIVASPDEVYSKYGATHLVTVGDILDHQR